MGSEQEHRRRFGHAAGAARSDAKPTVPCAHCGADMSPHAAACRACGYDGEEDHDDSYEEDFDYDQFIEDEFSDQAISSTLKPWQRAVVLTLVIAFAATLLWPLLFG